MMNRPDTTGKKQGRDSRGRFKKGRSGNSRGRPAGARNKATMIAQAFLDDEAENLTRKAVELALTGDPNALRLCLERLVPRAQDRPLTVSLPPVKTSADAAKAMSAIIEAVAGGELTPTEGRAVAGLVENYRRTLETEELEGRVTALEAESKGDGK